MSKKTKTAKIEEIEDEEDEHTYSEGTSSYVEDSDNSASSSAEDDEEEFDEKRDAIGHPEITDSSASENEAVKDDSESEGYRMLDMSKCIFVFEHVIKRFYMLKKSAKEANKQLKLEKQDEKTKVEGVVDNTKDENEPN